MSGGKVHKTILDSQGKRCSVCKKSATAYDVYTVGKKIVCQHGEQELDRFSSGKSIETQVKHLINDSRVNKFRELEIKMAVPNGVTAKDFISWIAKEANVKRYVRVTGQDVYWEKNGTVVRHRLFGSSGAELTVKNRKSGSSTVDRVEVDLHLANQTKPEDVATFLSLLEYRPNVIITKTSHIFLVRENECDITVVFYEVTDDTGKAPVRAYVEVEIEKDADILISSATKILKKWQRTLNAMKFELISDSLYEIYSGKRYQVV